MERIENKKMKGDTQKNRQQCDFMSLLVKIRQDTQDRQQGDLISLQNKNRLRSTRYSIPPDVT
jgi:hypothetical protein